MGRRPSRPPGPGRRRRDPARPARLAWVVRGRDRPRGGGGHRGHRPGGPTMLSESSPAPDPAATPVPEPPPSPWNVANALTVLRILLVPVYGWLLLAQGGDHAGLRTWAAVVFCV